MADHVTNRMLRDKAWGRARGLNFRAATNPCGLFNACLGARQQFRDIDRKRLSFTTTVPLATVPWATGRLFARMLTASSSEASSSMIAPRPSRQHLMNRRGRGAKHSGDVDGDLVEFGHVSEQV